jgi:alcohol dehydrogenase class IV
MAHAALLSGLALANSGLGMAHGVAAALGVHGAVSHGLACAVLLPVALRANRRGCEADLALLDAAVHPDDRARSRSFAADRFLDEIDALSATVGVPRRLSDLGVRREQIPLLVRDSRGSSMSGNPRDIDDQELTDLLEHAL